MLSAADYLAFASLLPVPPSGLDQQFSGLNHDRLRAIAARNNIYSHLLALMRQTTMSQWDPLFVDHLQDRVRLAQRFGLLHAYHLRRVLAAFAEHGLAVMPIKGPLLSEKLYGDPTFRPSADLDIL
ncbi:MAG: nucleotidyltransferase family protein, partial [Bacteroidota bacterium]